MSSSSSSLLLPLSRKLLLHNTANPPSSSSSSSSYLGDSSNFDANVVMVLSVLLCALICSLGLNSIIRCALRCSNLVVTIDSEFQSNTNSTTTSEVIRSANTGVKKKALKTFPTVTFSSDLKLPGLDSECVICLSDFANGDRLRILPTCNHGFHIRCIDKWLSSHSSCPKCRHSLIHTCHKIVSSSTTQSSSSSNTILTIHPLQPEPLIPHYRQLITN